MALTVFYDGLCPLCSVEISQLRRHDRDNKILFEDIHAPDFVKRFPYVDQVEANRILHGQLSNGDMIYGLDVTHQAWKAVGKHRWLAILRWPGIKLLADYSYRFFARHRNMISSLIMGKRKTLDCESCRAPDWQRIPHSNDQ
jgi:predicted DCC family thiol-disulfide oxidoreductase YuxK